MGRLPTGWTARNRRVKVATTRLDRWRIIAYYTNTIGMKLVRIPRGEFMMGSEDPAYFRDNEKPVGRARISEAFYMGAHEVTQGQYEKVMGKNPSDLKGTNHPVGRVFWHDAREFCRKLSESEGVTYRLPAETEWEYGCRAGSRMR